jgi:L-aspartate oxidase
MADYDLIVVGSGIAGLATALFAAADRRVLLLTKAGLHDSNTWFAQGGIAAAIGGDDDARLHARDTLEAGAGLAEPAPVQVLTASGRRAIEQLERIGVDFDREASGRLALGREGAHGLNRILHAGGDATGAHIAAALGTAVRHSSVTLRERHLAIRLDQQADGRISGLTALDGDDRPVAFNAPVVVLATGGAGQLFARTTNPAVATADGLALAAQAGAVLTDLEFYQFHPTALALAGAPAFLISEAVRGEGARLRNAAGRAFMADYHPLAELAPRDVVARAILAEMRATKQACAYLDLSHLPPARVVERFPTIAATCRQYGLDLARDPLPVAPAAHYYMGGIRTDLWGATSRAGLYAAGEVACTAVHGANRLASNSLLEGIVFAERIVRGLTATTSLPAPLAGAEGDDDEAIDDDIGPWLPDLSLTLPLPAIAGKDAGKLAGLAGRSAGAPVARTAVQQLLWERAGLLRDGLGLAQARRQLDDWLAALAAPVGRADYERYHLLIVGRLLVEAAWLRRESRGAHYRSDYPRPSSAWRRHISLMGGSR